MVVGADCAIAWESHLVLTHDLTVREFRVGVDALLRTLVFGVEEVQLVDVFRRELCCLNVKIVEEASGLVEGCDVGAADIGLTITGLNTGILPSIMLFHGHDVVNAHLLLSCNSSNLRNALSLNTQSLVESLSEQDIGFSWVDMRVDLEANRYELLGKQRRPVVLSCVNPAIDEVVEPIWQSVCLPEEVLCSLLVKLVTDLLLQW